MTSKEPLYPIIVFSLPAAFCGPIGPRSDPAHGLVDQGSNRIPDELWPHMKFHARTAVSLSLC